MEKLKAPTSAGPGSQVSRRGDGSVRRNPNDPLPKISNRLTDIEIPRSAWSPWTETGKPRELQRQLTSDERRALEARARELEPIVASFLGKPDEEDKVAVAIADLFGSYRSMRQTGEEAVAILMATARALQEFPLWAIDKACRSMQTNGVWRDGAFDRKWPPNDSEIVDAVRKEVRLYADSHRSAVALLEAKVEGPDKPAYVARDYPL